ncbi:DUF423 domain-containing protein [Enterovibrio norvegicus]|uniref:DUF423 domain-containing protein n=1 Tax=Enterovibrio norvegicus TaxID=188144 RepID=A0A2N7LES4_9GAMM|nr:DUF423 domain-containing protein [Enterovibrio norvegicus]PMN93897.1 hypothetical protein BCT23_11220 [Enterovibrio norvegicus]
MKNNRLAALGCVFAGIAVAIGAFAAHGLKAHLSEYELSIIEKGVHYQFWHALALIALALWQKQTESTYVALSGVFLSLGVVCFSGSLYGLALTDWTWLWPITPLGGLSFLVGWSLAAWGLWRSA